MGLLERLEDYTAGDMYPFHMPGHKRQGFLEKGPCAFPNPYLIDITEINGFDNLHHATGILKESMDWAAKQYGAKKTYYLVNGSTCGILSAVFATTKCGGKMLISRNCHLSVYHGIVLNRIEPEYVYPESIDSFGINGEIRAKEIEEILSENKKMADHGRDKRIEAVLLVSPTYEGIVSDIRRIAKIVHAFQIPLIVDEAHGAHLSFAPEDNFFPESALSQGADLVIQSLHKTLPSLTQTALLHVKSDRIDQNKVERYLRIFQSSSPSYLLMAGMERCIRYMVQEGRDEMIRYKGRLVHFYEKMHKLKKLKMLDGAHKDPSKLVISAQWTEGLSGEKLKDILRERFHLEAELCAPEYVLAMTSLMDTDAGFARLEEALLAIDREYVAFGKKESRKKIFSCIMPSATQVLSPARALEEEEFRIPLAEATGNISKEFVFLYPPGIPILVPGEKVSKEILSRIFSFQSAGLPLQGLSDPEFSTILAVACPDKSMIK
ncbi:MAG: aminotransferase class I/II-fold pyridoxal phosphate-dependent enzyme [Lachnospiraceae bacterium]|nr:aminotransferase class I/II-fold pyridoxal phosphate-dependent enzyme [Lachnospiraceae bacterium]